MRKLALFLSLAAMLAAQVTSDVFDPLTNSDLIEKGLQSANPLQVAVSALRSVQVNDPRRGQWLRNALSRSSSLQPEPEGLRARRVIFDALIRTRITVPLAELLPFYDQFPAAVMAVVARGKNDGHEDRSALLKKTEEDQNTSYWHAAASLVDRQQLIRHLLDQAKFEYPISIVDRDFLPVMIHRYSRGIIGGVPGVPGAMGGVPVLKVPWPDETIYEIETSGDAGHVLTCCVGGNIYLKEWPRSLHAYESRQKPDPAWQDHDREVMRVLLSFTECPQCSYDRPDFPIVRGGKATIVWHSEEQARPLLLEAVDQYLKELARMTSALGENLSEAEIRSKVRIWIRDWRRTKTEPIPLAAVGVQFSLCASSQSVTNWRCVD
jgi:hypothetical protein